MAASKPSQMQFRNTDPAAAAQGGPLSEPGSDRSSITSSSGSEINEKKDRDMLRPTLQEVRTQSTIAISRMTTQASQAQVDQPVVDTRKWWERLNPLRRHIPPIPAKRSPSREYSANWFSLLIFQWMAPMMTVGYKRPLELNDIWLVNPNRSAELLSTKLEQSFQKRVKRGDRYPLLFALHETFKREFWIGGMCRLAADCFQTLSPFLLRFLITFAQQAYNAKTHPNSGLKGPNLGRGLGLAFGIAAMQVCQSLCTNHFIYRGFLVGGQSRASMICVIFNKAMRISGRARAGGSAGSVAEAEEFMREHGDDPSVKKKRSKGKKSAAEQALEQGDGLGWGNGRVVNLMGTDTYRVDQACGMFHLIWTGPIAITITLVLLLINLTYSALAGFALLVIGMPLLTWAVKVLARRRRGMNKITDERVSLMQEVLQGVKFVKFFGWESAFLQRLSDIRNREIHQVQFLLGIRNAINAVAMSLPIFASLVSFVTYSRTGHALNPAFIFSSLALFNSMRMPLNLLPVVISQVTDAWVSLGRIQEYLMCEDAQDDSVKVEDMKEGIVVKDASFTWERISTSVKDVEAKELKDKQNLKKKKRRSGKDDEVKSDHSSETELKPFSISDLDFSIGRKELVAVVGSVGSGKSSLLAALAGDMRRTKGEVFMGGSRAFCPQYAWIQNTTVRNNVVFGKDFDRNWYEKVIDACALRPDLEILPNGDMTEIGERGITVSGGQKQRMNIARAIYFDADIILMDDPLSAVDAHVGQHLFNNAICGLLKDKCRVLATHQLHVLSRCDRIIWLQEGLVEAIGTYPDLMANNPGFVSMMGSLANEQKATKKEDTENDYDKDKGKGKQGVKGKGLMQAEERAVAAVKWSVYKAYIEASGTILNGPIIVFLLIIAQGANITTSLWLSWWTSNKWGFSTSVYIGVYAALAVAQSCLVFCFSISLTIAGTTSSKKLMNNAMKRTLRAPMSFFDTTPLGRITNRFSKDVDIMDNQLTDAIRMYFFTLAMCTSVFILIICYFHYFAIALGPLLLGFLFSASYYRATAREVKRHEAVLRSDVFARFGEGLSGVASIRAYGLQERFKKELRAAVDGMDSAYFLTYASQRWLSVRLDFIGNCLVLTTCILVVTSRFSVNPSTSGLVLSYILSIVQMIQFMIRQLAEVENSMNATERINFYGTQLEEEAPLKLAPVPASWPEHGAIEFNNVQMRYREELPLVLDGLQMHVAGGERIGIVGRTGAGKSSIMSTIFRLTELSGGEITIDGVDISTIGLADLRSRLAIIPQDPTLFRGTIRSNLDPFGEHSDLELWSALRASDLVHEGEEMPTKESLANEKSATKIHLDSQVEEEGLNFSLGQRQLMALARALVRGSRIIVCDEATSSVDVETDDRIQHTIATAFKGRTLLCIAHRLRTIINYDRICVMDKGRIAQLDTPLNLFNEKGGIFRGMCERSKITKEDIVKARGDLLNALGGRSAVDDEKAAIAEAELELAEERRERSEKKL